VKFFGSAALPAHGSLSASLQAMNIPVPSSMVMVLTGRDASGASWTQQIAVPFLPQPTSASNPAGRGLFLSARQSEGNKPLAGIHKVPRVTSARPPTKYAATLAAVRTARKRTERCTTRA
jgi:hypothetical protein